MEYPSGWWRANFLPNWWATQHCPTAQSLGTGTDCLAFSALTIHSLKLFCCVYPCFVFLNPSWSLTLWCWCDISDPEVWTGYRSRTHVLPQSWDLGQGEHYFIPVLRLKEANLQRGRERFWEREKGKELSKDLTIRRNNKGSLCLPQTLN